MAIVSQDRFAEAKAHFHQLFEQDIEQLNGHAKQPLHELRRQALSGLNELDFPTRRDENWKYTNFNRALQLELKEGTNLSSIDTNALDAFRLQDIAAVQLVFVNGIFDESLSKLEGLEEGIEVKLISEALADAKHKDWIEAQFSKETDGNAALTALNLGFAKNGLFIHVRKGVVSEQPIQLLHITSSKDYPLLLSPQLFVRVEANTQLSIVETYDHLQNQNSYFSNGIARFYLGANAQVKHYRLQNESQDSFKVTNIDIVQERDSVYSGFTLDVGGRIVRNNLGAKHLHPGTETNMYGVYLGKKDQHIDNQTFMDHAAAHCTSNELYKGILADKARGVFNGKVMVRKDAQKINAFQQNSSLVLSKTAIMDTKPQLEIYADDVRCSHGATIGQLDETSVFYLRSRGLTDEQARALLQHAFILEVLEFIAIDELKEHAEQLIMKKFAE